MKKFGVDIITDEASYRRFLKANCLRDGEHCTPPDYPCTVSVAYDSYGDFPSLEFKTARDVKKEAGNLHQLLVFMTDLKDKMKDLDRDL